MGELSSRTFVQYVQFPSQTYENYALNWVYATPTVLLVLPYQPVMLQSELFYICFWNGRFTYGHHIQFQVDPAAPVALHDHPTHLSWSQLEGCDGSGGVEAEGSLGVEKVHPSDHGGRLRRIHGAGISLEIPDGQDSLQAGHLDQLDSDVQGLVLHGSLQNKTKYSIGIGSRINLRYERQWGKWGMGYCAVEMPVGTTITWSIIQVTIGIFSSKFTQCNDTKWYSKPWVSETIAFS